MRICSFNTCHCYLKCKLQIAMQQKNTHTKTICLKRFFVDFFFKTVSISNEMDRRHFTAEVKLSTTLNGSEWNARKMRERDRKKRKIEKVQFTFFMLQKIINESRYNNAHRIQHTHRERIKKKKHQKISQFCLMICFFLPRRHQLQWGKWFYFLSLTILIVMMIGCARNINPIVYKIF